MIIKELINELKKYDENLPVCVSDTELDFDNPTQLNEENHQLIFVRKDESHYYNDKGLEVFGEFVSLSC